MKINIKLIAALALGGFMASCAEQDIQEYVVTEVPESQQTYGYLKEYGNIKDYIDRAKYPNFKLGCALGAVDYTNRGVEYRVANANFDEITLGNAMKYASVVNDDGTMNFMTIYNFLKANEGAGPSVYGHTLAWHAQQNVTYLKSLMADIEIPTYSIPDMEVDFSTYTEYPFSLITGGATPKIEDGVLKVTFANKKHKFYLAENIPTEPGKEYEIHILVKSSSVQSPTFYLGDDNSQSSGKAELTEDWSTVIVKLVATGSNCYLRLDPGNNRYNIEVAKVEISHMSESTRPLNAEEKYENIKGAMTEWCRSMMQTCEGRVSSWDLINEAISGGGNVNGYYDLQHTEGGSASDFFWQDYLGSEEYGPVVEKAARDAYEEYGGNRDDLTLFINDYNLESDWDDNKKLKSLIYWVGVWEKGGAKIDGLSSQMHISYYENKRTMQSKADHMVKMLQLMAKTGKLVRISELDMGYVDINDVDLPTDELTFEQKQNMANYYRFIIQMFLQIVPVEQQYGICQWCLTDAPANSGWRANSPVGLWDLNWDRKPAYAGFCEAFINAGTEQSTDYFKFLEDNGLTHYINEKEAE